MTQLRSIKKSFKGKPTIEGAGVHLKRAFGYSEVPLFDPFLMLDDFHSNNPADYIAGFPWHPHRGIETITYLLSGEIKHHDSMKNGGVINGGEIQWMTAGNGIIHSEMPQKTPNELWGFQLWANLPAKHKMMNPRYRDIKSDQIPVVTPQTGVKISLICGEFQGIKGPVQDIVTDPSYFDVSIDQKTKFTVETPLGHTVFAYVVKGKAQFDSSQTKIIGSETAILFNDGDHLEIQTTDEMVRFLLLMGKPIKEPVAWYGPIVMNTQDELRVAFEEFENGTFIKI